MTATDAILRKALVESGLDTSGWATIQAGLRDRAFFMAEVAKAKILHAAREGAADLLRSGKSMSEIRRELRRQILESGYTRPEGKEGTIKDLLTKQRLDVMLKANRDQALGYARHLRATTRGALAAFPAYEFVRVRQRKTPRGDWPQRWEKAAREAGWQGVARGTSRMVALKTSPVWVHLSAFGNPFPPFDFGSGMGLDDVDAEDCKALGLAGEAKEQKPPEVRFNGSLQAEVPFNNDREWKMMKDKFGDQIQIDKTRGVVRWRDHIFEDNFDKGGRFTIRLGVPQKGLIDKLAANQDTVAFVSEIKGRPLTVTQTWLDRKRRDGVTDHRVHFEDMPDYPQDVKLEKRDVGIIPSLWHHPDRVFDSKGKLCLEVDALDGSIFRAFVGVKKCPELLSFYRTRETFEQMVRQSQRGPGVKPVSNP